MVNHESMELIKARLILAQQLLEESDKLEGFAGYNYDSEKWWLHPRHERESLVIYLLLTCFDLLGQNKEFKSFDEWLASSKCASEREAALADFSSIGEDYVASAKALHSAYNKLYGVKHAFTRGILTLEPDIKEKFLKSVEVSFSPDYGMYGPETITSSFEIEDKELELELKLSRIYKTRNKFTHKLDQYHRASTAVPTRSIYPSDARSLVDGSAWGATIEGGELYYYSGHYEIEKLPSGGARQYSFNNWPFVLFQTVYSSIGIPFDITDIKLNFYVRIWGEHQVRQFHGIPHKLLKPLRDAVRAGDEFGLAFEAAFRDSTRIQEN